MKKLILTAVAVVASLNLYAQGTVAFQNASGSLVLNGRTGASVAFADGIVAALYWAPTTDANNMRQILNGPSTDVASRTDVGKVSTSLVPGRFLGGTRTTGTETAGGAQAWFQVRAWELAYGGTYEAAVAAPAQNGRLALRGESNKFLSSTGNPGGTPPTAAINLATSGLQGFTVVVPEPSVIALGLLGAGALLLLRRRK
jgi:hypothetical protein